MEDKLNVPDTNAGDMISRQGAMEMLMAQNVIMDGSEYHNGFNAGVNRAQEVIRNLPPVQPKRGKWKPRYYDVAADTYVEWACSECGYVRQKGREDGNAGEEPEADFCEKCGVKMER